MALTKSLSFSLRRKRVLISELNQQFSADFDCFTSMNKVISPEIPHQFDCSSSSSSSSNFLEDLPQELLIKVVCGVDHDDLKQLFFVSKTIRNSVIIAKNLHFAYSTPSKTIAFRNSTDNPVNCEEYVVPNAPKPARRMKRRRFDRKSLEKITVALFSDEDVVQRWPRRSLFMDIDS